MRRRASSAATYAMGRCDALAVARACVQAQARRLRKMGIDAGIELPCGALPWLSLDEPRLRQLLDLALEGVALRAGAGSVQLALWRGTSHEGAFRLRVEAYADDPAAGSSFELDVAGSEATEAPVPPAGRERALLVEDHPARRRILAAQFARLGVACDTAADASVAGASIAGHYGLVWLGGAAAVDRVALVTSLRLLERKDGHAPARIAGLRNVAVSPAPAPADIDAWVEWPWSLDELQRFCTGTPPQENEAVAVFFREGLRDAAAIRAALAAADWPAVVRHAHRIKGGTVVLGEHDVCALAARIESAARRTVPDPIRLQRLLSVLEDALRCASI